MWFLLPFLIASAAGFGFGREALSSVSNCSGYGSAYSHCLPDDKRKNYDRYIEKVAEEGYRWASDAAYDEFRKIKYGVRIHWGIYSIVDSEYLELEGAESWPFLEYNNTVRNWYQELYKQFNPSGWEAKDWMEWFQECHFKMFMFTAKHHEGFSMYNTSTKVKYRINWENSTAEEFGKSYDVTETPFGRDVIQELVDAARETDMKINLYFSHPDWHDPDFRPYGYHPLQVPSSCDILDTYCEDCKPECYSYMDPKKPGKFRNFSEVTKESQERMVLRHRNQILELMSNYGKIDMLSLDIYLGGPVWPEVRKTLEMVRKVQPDVMIRARGIGNYGDYYTPEDEIPGSTAVTDEPWFVIYQLGDHMSYDPKGNYKGTKFIVHGLADVVAKGGNFMVGIGPDANGRFHPKAVKQVKEAGEWLDVNEEAIFGTKFRTKAWMQNTSNSDVRFTQSEDESSEFAILMKWPGTEITLESVIGVPGKTVVKMLGVDGLLKWNNDVNKGKITVYLPSKMQDPSARPCNYAWVLKINGGA